MNPSARPWYPPGAPQTPAVRRQNDPYQFSAVRCPPTPICADENINVCYDVYPTAPLSVKGPYRSAGLRDAGARQTPLRPSLVAHWPPEPASATLSSLGSQGGGSQDFQEINSPREETYCNVARAASGSASCKMTIPLPRSRRTPPQQVAPIPALPIDKNGDDTESDNSIAAATVETAPPAPVPAAPSPPAPVPAAAAPPVPVPAAPSPVSASDSSLTPVASAKPPARVSSTPAVPATKKLKARIKREEKWTIVRGKPGSDGVAAAQSVAARRNPSTPQEIAMGRLFAFSPTTTRSSKQQQQPSRVREEVTIIEESGRARRRRAKSSSGSSTNEDELLDLLVTRRAHDESVTRDVTFAVMGVPLACVPCGESLLPNITPVPVRFRHALRTLLRSLAMSEMSNAKTLLLQRALQGMSESNYHQCPALVCAILLEASDSCVDVEKSLQTCYKALQLAEKHNMTAFEMLARFAITRTFARVIDTVEARGNLTRAAAIAISLGEKAALGWIAMQMGVTLELSGAFPESLAWYDAAEGLARATQQHQLLCDILCCQSIAYSAVGEVERAQCSFESSRELLALIPKHRHQRALQNHAQLKSQLGDMDAALSLQEEELDIAKELGDNHAIARCMGAIALTKRFQCRYDEAAEHYMEELCVHSTIDPRQTVESLTGAAACWRMGGHLQKAYDYCMRALRQAQQCQDITTLAKALVELAETELRMDRVNEAQVHLHEALATIERVDEAEQRQYLVKAALCEVEWRCCGILEQAHIRRGEAFDALQCADRCHVPNTAQVAKLLRRRRRRYMDAAKATAKADGSETPEAHGGVAASGEEPLVSRAAVARLLRAPVMQDWCVVCYSLPWNEGLDFTAYVLGSPSPDSAAEDNGDDAISCVARSLRLTDEVVALLCAPNALSRLLDTEMRTERGERLYGDTPLWPQHYSRVAFDFQQRPENASRVAASAADPMYCLRLLYDAFVRPLEADVRGAAGIVFVGDGIFTRLPFHALHDGARHLVETFATVSCCSLALLCTLHAAEPAHTAVERRCAVLADAASAGGLLDAFLDGGATPVQRIVVDAEETRDGAESDAEPDAARDAETRAAEALLRRLHRRARARLTRNALYRAVHEAPGGLLDLRLRALPEVKEDYCGAFVGASSEIVACHSGEVANTWDLRGYALVVCSGVGTYSGLSIHETGVPVYRSLQYAGARRMLIAAGSRVPPCGRVAAGAAAAALDGRRVADAMRDAYVEAIQSGMPLEDWAGLVLTGLP